MRSGDSPGITDQTNLLTTANCITGRDQRPAEMEVRSHDSPAMIHVHDIPGEKEVADERHNTAIRSKDGRSDYAAEIDPEMPAGHRAVEHPARSEATRHCRSPRSHEGLSPHRCCVVRAPSDLARRRILALDSAQGLGVERLREAGRDRERARPARSSRRRFRNAHRSTRTVERAGGSLNQDFRFDISRCVG